MIANKGQLTLSDELKLRVLKKSERTRLVAETVAEACKRMEYSAVDELISIARESEDLNLRAHIAATILKYVAPQLKSVEVSAPAQETHEQALKRLVFLKDADIVDAEIINDD